MMRYGSIYNGYWSKMQENSQVYEFISIGELAETTTQLLSLNLQHKTNVYHGHGKRRANNIEQIEHLVLQRARDYLAEVREGFMLSVRTSEMTQWSEINFLLDRIFLDWAELSRELGLDDMTNSELIETQTVNRQLLSYNLAMSTLHHMPTLPPERVTFPHNYMERPTYADITPPDSPAAMLMRIDELEQMLWQFMANNLEDLMNHYYAPLRRTYGFFEASAYMISQETKRFGMRTAQFTPF